MCEHGRPSHELGRNEPATVVLHVGGLNWAAERAMAKAVAGVLEVAVNPVAQTAMVTRHYTVAPRSANC
jgi:hypothetical protein